VPDDEPVLAMEEHLVRDDQRAHDAHEGEGGERRDRDRSRDEGEQHDGPDRPSPEDSAGRPKEEGDVSEQVEGRAAAEPGCGHRFECLVEVAERRLEPEGEEDERTLVPLSGSATIRIRDA
jgi:hypothetical protein